MALAGCTSEGLSASPSEPVVTVQAVATQALAVEQSRPGRTVAYMISEVRPQVGGIIQKRMFTEGEDVKAGQVLYQIDSASYQASYDNARATLAQRSEEHTSELQSLMRISYAVFCLYKKNNQPHHTTSLSNHYRR